MALMLAVGIEAGGARRWIRIGPLVVQPAILLGPMLLVALAREPGLALAGFWTGLALAGVLGNYPVPVIGFGASYVLGWALALGLSRRSPPP